jgi:chorismate mutase-like protein
MLQRLFPVLLLVMLSGCRSDPGPPPNDPAIDTVLERINDRLVLMEEVAKVKRKAGTAVADPKREQELIEKVKARAEKHGLTQLGVQWFFLAQIEAAKRVQETLLQKWKDEGAAPEPTATLQQLRQRIDIADEELLRALVEARKHPPAPSQIRRRANDIITAAGVDEKARATAIRPLLEKE